MINKVILIGNVGADPTIRCFENGSEMAKFRLVTSERFKDKEGNSRELNEWHNVEAWGNPAKYIDQYVRKGDRLYIEGKIHYEEYKDKQGQMRNQTIIRLDVVRNLTPRTKEQGEQSTPATTEPTLQASPQQATPAPQAQPKQQELTGIPEPPQVPLPPMPDDDLPF